MSIILCPEDMLLEYIKHILATSDTKPAIKNAKYISKLPKTINLSEEFFEEYKSIVNKIIPSFTASAAGTREFWFPDNDVIKTSTPSDEFFWQNANLNLSTECPERIYDLMLNPDHNCSSLQPISNIDDNLVFAIITQNFWFVTFEELANQNASWLTKILFILKAGPYKLSPAWAAFLKEPKAIELPVRELLIEAFLAYIINANQSMKRYMEQFDNSNQNIESYIMTEYFDFSFELSKLDNTIELIKETVDKWCDEYPVTIQDERLLRNQATTLGLYRALGELETVLIDYRKYVSRLEGINESFSAN